ncbi:hypothetical protein AALP_AA3G191600 [Arabis alpina]|uniref:F-box associated beta-propeller type 3 domain-containing protein n=1 Tax=Arabis alpina TaxID=50452 RepID=A0A087HA78_ARAAL|nr:hypothetical protein AALP_AA3G191600 [Arabis alpina]
MKRRRRNLSDDRPRSKCRCVSKPWASILGRPDFTELFLTKSSTRPLLLFSCVKHYDELSLFSAPQIQNPNENSSIVATNYHTKFPVDYYPSEIYGSVHGLVYLNQLRIFNGKKVTVPVIYNPSTGQSLLLPRLKTARTSVMSFVGYDPIGKQYKVLSLTWPRVRRNRISEKHRVLTLGGTKKHSSWRMVKCFPHHPAYHGICINGVLYYVALVDGPMRCCALASF